MNSVDLATTIIGRLPMSPQERFALGAALICDIISTSNELYPSESPFMGIELDDNCESSILKAAAQALTIVEALPADHPMSFKELSNA